MGDGGRIINVSSTVARQGNPGSLVYAASKATVEGITRVMAVELRDRGIRVTTVNPGPVATDMFHSLSEDVQEYFKGSQPFAKPDDISDVIVFLAGPKSRWVNGGTISTNNGVILN
jgi:3-oxoacyl-[acyl-carrier protein] reductase